MVEVTWFFFCPASYLSCSELMEPSKSPLCLSTVFILQKPTQHIFKPLKIFYGGSDQVLFLSVKVTFRKLFNTTQFTKHSIIQKNIWALK